MDSDPDNRDSVNRANEDINSRYKYHCLLSAYCDTTPLCAADAEEILTGPTCQGKDY